MLIQIFSYAEIENQRIEMTDDITLSNFIDQKDLN
jgi:hypothetical protein